MNLSSGRSRWRTDKAIYVAYAPHLEARRLRPAAPEAPVTEAANCERRRRRTETLAVVLLWSDLRARGFTMPPRPDGKMWAELAGTRRQNSAERCQRLRSGLAAISRSPRVARTRRLGAAKATDRQTFHLLPGSQIPRPRGSLGRGGVAS